MPSAKFIFPPNFENLAHNRTFTIQIAIRNLQTGYFANPDTTYLAAPQMLNDEGNVIGHSHVAIEHITGFGQTTPTDPKIFAFYKGVNTPAVNGILSVNVTGGLPAGYYRASVLTTALNHQTGVCGLFHPRQIPLAHGLTD